MILKNNCVTELFQAKDKCNLATSPINVIYFKVKQSKYLKLVCSSPIFLAEFMPAIASIFWKQEAQNSWMSTGGQVIS